MSDKELDFLKDGRKNAYTGWFYAIQRIDLLIISISGAGVYVTLEALKYAHDNKFTNLSLIKFSGILFVLAIIVNFLSQYFGKESNLYHIKMCSAKITADEPPSAIQQQEIGYLDCKADLWDKLTRWSNYTSAVFMGLALILEIRFFFVIL